MLCSALSLLVLVCTNSLVQAERFSDGVFFRLKIIMVFELITARPGYHYDYLTLICLNDLWTKIQLLLYMCLQIT